MKLYKVIALSVGALGNKIFKSGDTVTDKNFREGRADELVRQGFLKLIETETPTVQEINQEIEVEKELQVKSIDEISKADIIKDLNKRPDVKFNPSDNKKALYDLWIKK